MKKFSIKINNQTISTTDGKTILEVAMENGIALPFLCHHPDVKTKNHCNLCLVKVKENKKLVRACTTKVKAGMEILTDSPEIQAERIKNLNKILEKHLLECDDCVWFNQCKLLSLTRKFNLLPKNPQDKNSQVLQVGPIVFDQTKCVGCNHCVDVCPTKFLSLNKQGKIELSKDDSRDCTNCGQCIIHCPVGAVEGVGEFEELKNNFKDKNTVTVVQFAPATRVSIGEEFGMAPGEIATGKLVAGLKKLGFDYVFDTAAGADFTTTEEAGELVERLSQNKNLPAMSSCCPAWVKFLEFNYPEFVPNLCTSRSPQIILGGIIKNYWSKTKNLDPKNIYVVSIMPCVAKKFEIKRQELTLGGHFPVDRVLTVRELARLLKSHQIDLKNIKEKTADDPLGSPSGAGVIYGSSGGVFESAFRTAYFKMTGKELPRDAVKELRGTKGIKTKQIKIGDRVIKVCVVNGIKNAKQILEKIKKNPRLYDAIEVMACPGGCVGGGGQPMSTNKKTIEARSKSLYAIDAQKNITCAHNNPTVQKVYAEFFVNDKIKKDILHTRYAPRKKSPILKLKNSR